MFAKKIHKIFRSRYFWGVLGIVLELVQLLAVFTLLFEYFLPITVLGILFHVGILLYVINRDEIPEFKIPWLIGKGQTAKSGLFLRYRLIRKRKSGCQMERRAW